MTLDYVLYTHSDYADVWPIFFGQANKYWPADASKIVFVNKEDERIPTDWKVIIYDDTKIYRERVLSCLVQLESTHIIYHHEDMFLYDKPDYDRLNKYVERVSGVPGDNYIKLIRGGSQKGFRDSSYPELRMITQYFDYIFAIQPTIWYLDSLIEVHTSANGNTIWEFEIDAQRVCREHKIYGYYVDDGGIRRGLYHWDSNVYPYIATAIVKGKWNLKEYYLELTKLLAEYNIDYTKRGSN